MSLGWIANFYWTPGWGNVATVVVALAAIIVGSWWNARTLRRAAHQFEQQRTDARIDKLRTEIAKLCAALNERRAKIHIAVDRSSDLTRSITEEIGDADQRRQRYLGGVKAIFAQDVSSMYLRINAHAVTIMMLTTDDAICEPVTEIIDAARQQQQAFETMLAQPGQAEPRDANEFTPEILEYDKTLESARKTLLTFGHEHWTQDFDA